MVCVEHELRRKEGKQERTLILEGHHKADRKVHEKRRGRRRKTPSFTVIDVNSCIDLLLECAQGTLEGIWRTIVTKGLGIVRD